MNHLKQATWALWGISSLIFSFEATAIAPEPRYVASLKQAEDINHFTEKNEWFKEFRQSNLYQGLMLRSGSVFGALPKKTDGKEEWKGRFADYLISKIAGEHPAHFYYFQKKELVQPIGLAIQGLGESEKTALNLLVEALRSAPNQKVKGETLEAIPVLVSKQKFALVLNGDCAAVSRDPDVAVWSATLCVKETPIAQEARVVGNFYGLAGTAETALAKYFGLAEKIQIDLNGLSSGKLAVTGASIGLLDSHRISNIEFPESFLKALPATTHLMSVLSIPGPSQVSEEGFKGVLAKDSSSTRQGKYFAASYFFLGNVGDERNLDGLLIDNKSSGGSADDWTNLFEGNFGAEIFVKSVCKNALTVVSPSAKTIEIVETACAGKIPSLAQAPDALKKTLVGKGLSQSVFVNVGQAAAAFIDAGWNYDTKDAMPAELTASKKLLEKIPALALGGQANGNQISFKAAAGAL